MATTAYTIYDAHDQTLIDKATAQLDQDGAPIPGPSDEYLWQTESARTFHRPIRAPRFVRASESNDDTLPTAACASTSASSATIYRSLVQSASTSRRASPTPPPPRPESALLPAEPSARPPERRTRNNWFIMRALEGTESPPRAPTRTLADMVTPAPGEAPFTPPVFLALDPANRGWTMLEKSGWREGEAVGLTSRAHRAPRRVWAEDDESGRERKQETTVKTEVRWDDDVYEVKKEEIIDLTLSDDDDDDDADALLDDLASTSIKPEDPLPSLPSPSTDRRALLTPLPTVLKADRLGIGMKAKTRALGSSGVHVPQKRVTHNSAALAAHIRDAARARERKTALGRGTRGFARARRQEQGERQGMLSYMNS